MIDKTRNVKVTLILLEMQDLLVRKTSRYLTYRG